MSILYCAFIFGGVDKNNIRPILIEFKSVMYERNEEDMENRFEEFFSSEILQKYTKAVAYFKNVYEIRNAWASCFRIELRLKGINTNNPVESQFLVIKDKVLNRMKEVNINGLLTKLCMDLTNHYRTKLLRVAAGKFDGCYSDHFKGIGKASKGSCGFKLPPHNVLISAVEKVGTMGDSIFRVPSLIKEDIKML